jgi:polyisoprenoid-binding protein YceI
MPTYDQNNADCFVFTFKEGLLSAIAHDLRIKVERFTIDVGESSVVASFDTSSLRVDTPMKDGKENPSALNEADKAKIATQIREEVLHSARHPEARFQSRSVERRANGGYDLAGDLALHGVTRLLQARTEAVGSGQQLDLTLHQPDFEIVPFRAMMGTLKIQADVKIRIVTR